MARRKKLGLPEIKVASVDEIKILMDETNFKKKILRGSE
jgi:hypothetical protein